VKKSAQILVLVGACASLATGCIVEPTTEISDALPTADGVRVNLPESAATLQLNEAGTANAALGEIAESYILTRQVTRDLNGAAGWVLLLVHTVVQFPATSVDGNVYTWGPHSDALDPAEWRLIVTENDGGTSYDWQFDGRSKLADGAQFETILSGHAVPGAEPHRGSGDFMIDFDAAERVDPIDNDESGQVSVVYDLENRDGTPATLAMVVNTTAVDDGGAEQPVVWEYGYAENLDGSGDFEFVVQGNMDDASAAPETATIRSRWQADGQGRGDFRVAGGDLGDVVVEASECWDGTFARVFYSDNLLWRPTEGDVASCAFAESALPSL